MALQQLIAICHFHRFFLTLIPSKSASLPPLKFFPYPQNALKHCNAYFNFYRTFDRNAHHRIDAALVEVEVKGFKCSLRVEDVMVFVSEP